MSALKPPHRPTPPRDCGICPRLAAFRAANAAEFPDWHNAPVASFGDADAALLIVGLAPGLRGANRTARPFTGDYAGDLLYATLADFGYTRGQYDRRADDGLTLVGCRITNAVRCVPPQNKPIGTEVRACRTFLLPEITADPRPKAILALGKIAHDSVLATLRKKLSEFRFAHGAIHNLDDGQRLFDSYHCSRYNTNTGRLTPEMFTAVFSEIRRLAA
jgi:uracil-DNA glycosylase family 4